MTHPIPDEVCIATAEVITRASNRGGPFFLEHAIDAARRLLVAERDRAASIAEEYGRPDIAAKIRGEAV